MIADHAALGAGDTPLLTPAGSRRIDELQVGDLVLARDEHDLGGLVAPRAVEEVFVRFGRIMHLHVGGQVIRTTAEHPFYAENRGWTPAGELQVGERLATHVGGWVAVEDLLDTGEHERVYNLRVAEWHTYFVGAATWGFSVWAHNTYADFLIKTGLPDTRDAQMLYALARNPEAWARFKEVYPKVTGVRSNRKMVDAIRAANFEDAGSQVFHDRLRISHDLEEGWLDVVARRDMVQDWELRAQDEHHVYPREINRLFGDAGLLRRRPNPNAEGFFRLRGLDVNDHVIVPGNQLHDVMHELGGPYRHGMALSDRIELYGLVSEHFAAGETQLRLAGQQPEVGHYIQWGMDARTEYFGQFMPSGGGVWNDVVAHRTVFAEIRTGQMMWSPQIQQVGVGVMQLFGMSPRLRQMRYRGAPRTGE